MKIVHINDHYEKIGGAETLLFNTLEVLEEAGHQNVIIHDTASEVQARRKAYRIPGIIDIPLLRTDSGALRRFEAVLADENPDVIHLHDVGNPALVRKSMEMRPTLQSYLNHSFYCPGGMKYLPWKGKICSRHYGAGCLVSAFTNRCNSWRPDVLIKTHARVGGMLSFGSGIQRSVLSHYQKKELMESGIPEESIHVLPPFTFLPELDQNIPESEFIILFTGRVMPYKGLNFLLQAAAFLKIPYTLVVDGDGIGLEEAKVLARQLQISQNVRFEGWLQREAHLRSYKEASVVVAPAIWPEPFGMVGIEAMSYGKPVIAFDVGGMRDWLKDGKTGFLVAERDIRALAQKIQYLYENPEERRAMGKQGRSHVEESFSERAYLQKLMPVYQCAIRSFKKTV